LCNYSMNHRGRRNRSMTRFRTRRTKGLHAPPELTGWRKAWWWFDFIIWFKLARLRFIAVLRYRDRVTSGFAGGVTTTSGPDRPMLAAESGGDVEWFWPGCIRRLFATFARQMPNLLYAAVENA